MKGKLKLYLDRLDGMSLRERVLIFLMLAAVVVALIFTGTIDPLIARQKILSQNLVQTQAQTQAMEAQIQAMAEASKLDPDAPNKQRLQLLEAQRLAAYNSLAVLQKGLVSSDRMTALLRDLLGKNPRLKLMSVKTLAATPLLERAGEKNAGAAKDQATPNAAPQAGLPPTTALEPANDKKTGEIKVEPKIVVTNVPRAAQLGLYKHGVEISVEGSYADLLNYLGELEHMPWQVYWGSVSLSAQGAPLSRLTLVVYTLSLDKTWLSV